jgi:glycosyltransferase involved in cell wall biosynthesis
VADKLWRFIGHEQESLSRTQREMPPELIRTNEVSRIADSARAGTALHAAVIFRRLGPYHHARLRMASQLGHLTAIEASPEDRTYSWDNIVDVGEYERRVIHDGNIDLLRPALVKHRVFQLLDKVSPGVLVLPGWGSRFSLAALHWAVARKVPVVMMSDSYRRSQSPIKEALKRRVVALAGASLVAGTPHVDYITELGMPPQRVFTGYDVVDNEHFARGAEAARLQPAAASRRLPRSFFLAVSRLVPGKNLDNLISAFAQYRSRASGAAWSLVIVGDGTLREELLRLAQRLRVQEHVCFPGFVQYQELPACYGLASAFVHPSLSETWGLAVNEAMAAGLPVLVSKGCGCVVDLVKDEHNGLTFQPECVRSLADAMARVSSDRLDRAAMGQASREVIGEWSLLRFAHSFWNAVHAAWEIRGPRPTIFDRLALSVLLSRVNPCS